MVQEDGGARPRLITLLALSRATLQTCPRFLCIYTFLMDGGCTPLRRKAGIGLLIIAEIEPRE